MVYQHFLVSGQVQGVGFRAFTQSNATILGLSGKVRNLNDGRVEILVKGASTLLEQLRQILLRGPRHAKVDAMAVKEIAEIYVSEGFLIVEDGQKPWFDSSPL